MIKIRNLSFCYPNEKIKSLDSIDLEINKGELVVLCGESGCGKTTLTRMINGLIPNYYAGDVSGEVYVKDKLVNQMSLYDTAKIVGSVFQNPKSQFFNIDVLGEIAFLCENMGLPKENIYSQVDMVVNDFNIKHILQRSIFHLSGGEKQSVACASVAAGDPDVYVFDEPTANLDLTAIENLKNIIKKLKNKGKTIIIAEHRLYFLNDLFDRMIYMKNGKICKEFRKSDIENIDNTEFEKLGLRALKLDEIKGTKKSNINKTDEKISIIDFEIKNKNHKMCIKNEVIPKNNVIALIGTNGAGKTVFAKCLCGLEKKMKGTILFDDKSVSAKERLQSCYMVMQDVNHQLFTESVYQEVILSMKNPDRKKAEEILEDLNLLKLKDMHPLTLSGGQKQRVAIASAIASEKKKKKKKQPGVPLVQKSDTATKTHKNESRARGI
eukprot:TRINITY_DN11499_c0_g1_i7.p1 TRINITY_DN11499_c0_g1~~TRINITY_DN11499_c0_g1_i7.p1  ORF type:complete len:480 (-),score=65.31 TRINITY_DN11499_c0_g1_i7:111-1424(-)